MSERVPLLLDLNVATEGDRVVVTVSRSDSAAVLRGMLTPDEAWRLARQLMHAAEDVRA